MTKKRFGTIYVSIDWECSTVNSNSCTYCPVACALYKQFPEYPRPIVTLRQISLGRKEYVPSPRLREAIQNYDVARMKLPEERKFTVEFPMGRYALYRKEEGK